MRSHVAAALAALPLAVVLAASGGCSEPEPKKLPPEAVPKKAPVRPQPLDPFPVVEVKKIALGKAHVGYLKLKEEPPESPKPLRTWLVFDTFFRELGFYTTGGATYRWSGTQARSIGTMTPERSMKQLLKIDSDEPIELVPMDPVRTIEGEPTAAGEGRGP